jgi:undecaprenyl-diphosphatase
MEIWQAVVLGLVEGITEYLPVSSTGHLIIASELMGLKTPEAKSSVNAFEIVIQGGAILAVAGLYFPRFVSMLRGLMGKDNAGFALLVNLLIAFTPAVVVGYFAKSFIDKHLFNAWAVIVAFAVGGVYMIVVDQLRLRPARHAGPGGGGKELADLTPRDALTIGLLQCVAMWPGTSRSMMTITGGVLCGLRPAAAAEFSFLLGMPTLLAATAKALYDNLQESKQAGVPNFYDQLGPTPVIVGLVVAAISAALAVKWLVGFLNRHGLTPFGIYRLAAALLLGVLVVSGLVQVSA